MFAQVYSVPSQTKGRRKALLEWKSIDLSSKLSLTCGGNVSYYKSVHHPIPTCENGEHSGNVQEKPASSPFNWVSRYPGQAKEEKKAFFGGCKKGIHIVRLPPRALGCHKRWKSLSFCEIWNNPTPPLFFIIRPCQ